MRQTLRIVPLLSCLALPACGDSPSGPAGVRDGTLTATYSGGTGSGRITASGAPPADGSLAEYAVGAPLAGADGAGITGIQLRGDGRHDQVAIAVVNPRPGQTSPIDAECEGICTAIGLSLGAGATGTAPEWTCQLDEGAIRVTTIEGERIKGTFSGSGHCVSGLGLDARVSVEDGSFDVWLAGL